MIYATSVNSSQMNPSASTDGLPEGGNPTGFPHADSALDRGWEMRNEDECIFDVDVRIPCIIHEACKCSRVQRLSTIMYANFLRARSGRYLIHCMEKLLFNSFAIPYLALPYRPASWADKQNFWRGREIFEKCDRMQCQIHFLLHTVSCVMIFSIKMKYP